MRSDEGHRHQCEVRQLLRSRVERGTEWVRDWLESLVKPRGVDAVEKLRADTTLQWKMGNRGAPGDWR